MLLTKSINKNLNSRGKQLGKFQLKDKQQLSLNNKFSTAGSSGKVVLPPYLVNTAPTKITTLPNKIRVATEDGFGETATIGVYIDAGSVYETPETNGTAHFLEHMIFKGTTNRTQEQIEVEIENMGAQLNAYTSREMTVFYARAFKNDVPKVLDIIADILQNSNLTKEGIERERSTILKEKEVVEQNTEEIIFDYLHAAAYQGTPLAQTILGSTENIKKISRDNLVQYIQTHYTGPRMVVAAAGAVNHAQVSELANKAFDKIPSANKFDYSQLGTLEFTGSEIKVRDDDWHDVHTAVAFEGISWDSPDYVPFMILQTLTGSWDRSSGGANNLNSRLAEAVSTINLVNSYNTFNTCYNKTGLFGYYINAEYDRIEDALIAAFNEFNYIGKGLTEVELERAKNKVKAAYLMQLDGSNAVCEDIGRQVLTLNRRMSPTEFFMRVDATTVDDIKRIVDSYINDIDPAVSVYGNTKYMPDYNRVRQFNYWSRW